MYLCIYLSIEREFFFFLTPAPAPYVHSWARGQNRAAAATPCHSHNNTRSEPHLPPTPQLAAMLDPQPTERGQGWNLHLRRDNIESLTPWATVGTPSIDYFKPNHLGLKKVSHFNPHEIDKSELHVEILKRQPSDPDPLGPRDAGWRGHWVRLPGRLS